MSTERTATINALTALLRVSDVAIDARGPLTTTQVTTVAAWRTRTEGLAIATARGEATRLAKRVAALDDELKEITKRITDLVRQSPAGVLLDQPGNGPVTAAVALTAWSHLGRIRSEAVFASLAGASPIPHPPATSSDTASTAAVTGASTAPFTWLSSHECAWIPEPAPTSSVAPPKDAPREIRRCLKRYLARQVYGQLNAAANDLPSAT